MSRAFISSDEKATLRAAIGLLDDLGAATTAGELRALLRRMVATGVTCKACSGTGVRPLTPTESASLAAVTDAWESTGAIAARLPKWMTWTALCGRLVALEAIGAVESKRDASVPREKLWRKTPARDLP